MKNIRVRFAPSPTGFLHIGGVRTALFNYLFAKKHNGTFILRLEDTDQKRYVPQAEDYILQSLKWLDIEPDEGIGRAGDRGPYRQSERKEIYKTYVDRLLKEGKAYYAFDEEGELEAIRKQDNTFLYNFNHRQKLKNSIALGPEETQKLLDQNIPYVVRFKVPEQQIVVEDVIRGTITVDASTIDDKVLLKPDGMPTYHIANIVDDHLMNISHVIRGEEWLPSLPFHHVLYEAFGWEAPVFVHLPLILKPSGKGKLSKRSGDLLGVPVFPLAWQTSEDTVQGYKEHGFLPQALINLLVLIGWSPGQEKELFFDKESLMQEFSFEKIQKGGAKFNPEKALWINQKHIEHLSEQHYLEVAKNYLIANDKLSIVSEQPKINKILLLVRDRIKTLSDLKEEINCIVVPPSQYDEPLIKKIKIDLQYLEEFINIVQHQDLEEVEVTFKTKIKDKGWPMGQVMKSIRYALLGALKGPDLFEIIKIIGIEDTVNRVQNLKSIL